MSTPFDGVFITGTDTGIGKTEFALALTSLLTNQGIKTATMKPVASGCCMTPDGLRNDDAERLLRAASIKCDYEKVNPYRFQPAIAPHIAAQEAGCNIEPESIKKAFDELTQVSEIVVVEGVGGWCVPLNENYWVADLVNNLQIPVILVVGMRLGCINHALLSWRQIIGDGARCLGWIANVLEPDMPRLDQNIHTLKKFLDIPLLGTMAYHPKSMDREWESGLDRQLILQVLNKRRSG